MSYYSLQRVILNENKETKELNDLSSNYSRFIHKQQARDLDEDISRSTNCSRGRSAFN